MKVQLPRKLSFLFRPKRYKVAYGGRGAAKSWGFARALLILGTQKPLRIVCARETHKSIEDSVYALLVDQIAAMGLLGHYAVSAEEILGMNGTHFMFRGLERNVHNMKSLEGCDILWVEEAHGITDDAWETIIPTVRKDGSEIWISFNPRYEDDPTYIRFVKFPPPNCVSVYISYLDNPWFPKTLQEESDTLKARDIAAWEHVYGGETRKNIKGALWTSELIEAGRVSMERVPPYMQRVVIAIDPAVTAKEDSDETGIGVAGLAENGHCYVFRDLSMVASPLEWARVAIAAYRTHQADRIVGEVNNGGDLVGRNIQAVDPRVPFRAVHASRGKAVRAEPVVNLYQQGLVHHVGEDFALLEHQMTHYIPGVTKKSPDRMDWLVWAITDLVLDLEMVEEVHRYDSGYRISPV